MSKKIQFSVVLVAILFASILNNVSAQNSFPDSTNVTLDGYSIFINEPMGISSWARGLSYFNDQATRTAGIGLFGNLTTKRLFIGHGTEPWTGAGLFMLSDGRVGLGTTSPTEKLHVAGITTSAGYRTNASNTNFHQFLRDGVGAAVYINQVSSDVNHPILRLSSGTADANNANNVKLTVENNGNVGIGTTTPESLLDVAGDIQYSGIGSSSSGYSNFVRKKIFGFVSDKRTHYLLLYKSTDTGTRVVGRFVGLRSHGSSNPASLIMDVEAGRGTGTAHDINIKYSSISGNNPRYKISTVLLDYNGYNYVAIKIDPGSTSTMLSIAYFDGLSRMASLAVFPSDSVSNVTEYTATQDRKMTTMLSPVFIDGNLGVGTESPTHKLEVNGTIRSKEVIVEAANWPDYVFEESYNLLSLAEIEAFIKANKHLPEVPSAEAVEKDGVMVGEMNALLLKKIEELTLHVIDIKKENTKLKERLEIIENKEEN